VISFDPGIAVRTQGLRQARVILRIQLLFVESELSHRTVTSSTKPCVYFYQ
jgi:hypothetical protein